MTLYQLICDNCDKVDWKRLSMRERTTREQYCAKCGEQVALGPPVYQVPRGK